MLNRDKTLENIRKCLNEYDSIFMLGKENLVEENFSQNIILQPTAKKCLLFMAGMKNRRIFEHGRDIRIIPYGEYGDIEKLYYMYEFSDHMHILVDNAQYGNLNNYISTGLLTKEEAAMALLQ